MDTQSSRAGHSRINRQYGLDGISAKTACVVVAGLLAFCTLAGCNSGSASSNSPDAGTPTSVASSAADAQVSSSDGSSSSSAVSTSAQSDYDPLADPSNPVAKYVASNGCLDLKAISNKDLEEVEAAFVSFPHEEYDGVTRYRSFKGIQFDSSKLSTSGRDGIAEIIKFKGADDVADSMETGDWAAVFQTHSSQYSKTHTFYLDIKVDPSWSLDEVVKYVEENYDVTLRYDLSSDTHGDYVAEVSLNSGNSGKKSDVANIEYHPSTGIVLIYQGWTIY